MVYILAGACLFCGFILFSRFFVLGFGFSLERAYIMIDGEDWDGIKESRSGYLFYCSWLSKAVLYFVNIAMSRCLHLL